MFDTNQLIIALAESKYLIEVALLVTFVSTIILKTIFFKMPKSIEDTIDIPAKKHYPSVPGSMGWPIIGHLPYMSGANPYPVIEYYKKKYGLIFHLQLGSFSTVILTDYNDIKRAFASADFTDRPPLYFHEQSGFGFRGVGNSSGAVWKEQRAFALRHLHEMGLRGKGTSIEYHIENEIAELMKDLTEKTGQPLNLDLTLNLAVTNIVWTIIASRRMSLDDSKYKNFMKNNTKNIELLGGFAPLGYIPWLVKLLPDRVIGMDKVYEAAALFSEYSKKLIEEHRVSLDPENPRDYIDRFLIEQIKRPDSSFTELELLASVSEFFVVGGETISSTLRWAILLISSHSEVQDKMRNEIHQVIGSDGQATADDQVRMPYVNAVIMEVQRFADLIPFGNFRCNNERDVTFKGFLIPKGTMIGAFLGGPHRSPKHWQKPDEFYPQHFLDEEGLLRHNVEGFVPFSTGRRSCIGERLSKTEIFLFLVNFFQKFHFRLTDDSPTGPSFDADPNSGLVRWAPPYKVILEKVSNKEDE